MGNNSTSINIVLDRAQPTVYYTAEVISGQVQFTLSESIPTTDNIHLVLKGTVGYTTIHRHRMQNGLSNQVTNRHDICILRQKVRFGQLISAGHQRVTSGLNDMTSFEPGQYTYPFSIRLPDLLPPTLHPSEYPFVRYQLEVKYLRIN